MMKLEIGKIVGVANRTNWSQVHTFLPEDKEKFAKRGQLLAFISLTAIKVGLDVVAAGREIISRLHEEYFGSLENRPLIQLKQTLGRISQEVGGEVKIEIGAVSLVENVLNIALVGNGRVILRRNEKIATILQGGIEGVKFANGYVQKGDLITIASSALFETVAQGLIQAALASGLPEEAVEMLSPAVYGQEKESLTVGLIAKVEEEKEEITTNEVIKEPVKETKRKFRVKLDIFKTAREKFSFWLKGIFKKVNQGTIYLTSKSGQNGKSRKTLLTVSLILLLLLAVSVILGAKQRQNRSSEKRISFFLEQAAQKKEEGLALISLNPIKARQSLQEGIDILAQAKTDKISSPKLDSLQKDLENSLLSISKEYPVTPDVFFDLELIKKGAQGDDLSFSTDRLLILDKNNLAAYAVGFDKKSAIVAGGNQLEKASQLASFWPKVYVLASEGIIEADTGTKKQELIIKTDKDWSEPIDLVSFGGNLYLLDKKTIWQYVVSENGFGSKRNWLKNEVDLSKAKSMVIDGTIWVLNSDGSIWKFVRGGKENFAITGLSQPLASPRALYTDTDQKFLYVLYGSRVVVLSKTGEYQAQYVWQNLDVSGLAVSEKDSKIFLLSGAKIYAFEIKKE